MRVSRIYSHKGTQNSLQSQFLLYRTQIYRCYPLLSDMILFISDPNFQLCFLTKFSANVPYLLLFQSAMLCCQFISLQPTHMLSSPSLLEYGFSIEIEQVWWCRPVINQRPTYVSVIHLNHYFYFKSCLCFCTKQFLNKKALHLLILSE